MMVAYQQQLQVLEEMAGDFEAFMGEDKQLDFFSPSSGFLYGYSKDIFCGKWIELEGGGNWI